MDTVLETLGSVRITSKVQPNLHPLPLFPSFSWHLDSQIKGTSFASNFDKYSELVSQKSPEG